MHKLLFLLVILGGSLTTAIAQSNNQERILAGKDAREVLSNAEMIRYSGRSAAPNFIRLRPGAEPDAAYGIRFLNHALKLRAVDGFRDLNPQPETDNLGMTHRRMQQTYAGIPVALSMYLIHERGGKIASVNGDFFPNISVPKVPVVDAEVALNKALNHVGASVYRWQIAGEEEMLKIKTGNPSATWYPSPEVFIVPMNGNVRSNDWRLCYRFDIYATEPLTRQYVFVDAVNGSIVYTINRIHTADVVGTAFTKYSGTQSFTTDFTGSTYRLREVGRGGGIETYNLLQGTDYFSAVDFTDADNSWNNVNPQQDEVATDAHWGAEKTYDYYWLTYGRNSIDGAGFKLKSYVHYDVGYDNAFWDGSQMTYGDGSGSFFTPLTALDVCGHEVTHGLTEFSAGLVYANEPGALNESFSDIFGNVIEWYGRPADHSWLIGEDCTVPGAGGAIRDMENPNAFDCPDTYLGTFWDPFEEVHTNSGVQNKWFFLLTDGETGTNDNGDAYSVTGQGWVKSGAIAFRNLTVYLTTTSEYADARFYSIQAATDLYGGCTPEVEATTDAWYAVGVGPEYVPYTVADFEATPTSYCDVPANITFTNMSINGITYSWDFGDGGTSTAASPTHTYTAFGSYTVTLIADGGPVCGVDTFVRTAYIVLDSNAICSVVMTPGTNVTQTSCLGTLYDTGGSTGDYGPDENNTITIAPAGASTVTLNFTSFATEAGYDYLYIYDGPTTGSPMIGTYDGAALPGGGTITSTASSITLVFSSDFAIEDIGFAVNWECQLPTSVPNCDFVADDVNPCDGVVQFTDLSTNGPTSWLWNFGDGGTSTLQHPSHTYTTFGTYTVTLTATNAIGGATETKTAYIQYGFTVPAVSLCGPGSATLTATGAAGSMYYWYTAPSGGTSFYTGASYTTPVLATTTTYYVEQQRPASPAYVGPVNPFALGGGYHNNTSTQYDEFTVYSNMTLKSVYVEPGSAGPRTIQVWNNIGTLLWDTLINIPGTAGRITLNHDFTPGDYRIGGTEMDLYRNNMGGLTYPYTLAGLVSITGSSAGSDFFYYFYDWEVIGEDCISSRVPVTVSIGSGGTVSAGFTYGGTGLAVNFTNTSTGATSYSWDFGDGSAVSTVTSPSHTYGAAGSYTVTLIAYDGTGCNDTITQVIEVNAIGIDPQNGSFAATQVYPNPFGSELNFGLQVLKSGTLTVTATDVLGRELVLLTPRQVMPGEMRFTWNPGDHAAEGIYLVRISLNGQEALHKVVHLNR